MRKILTILFIFCFLISQGQTVYDTMAVGAIIRIGNTPVFPPARFVYLESDQSKCVIKWALESVGGNPVLSGTMNLSGVDCAAWDPKKYINQNLLENIN